MTMGWFTRSQGNSAQQDAPTGLRGMKYVPSFNEFVGDSPGLELEAENQMQQRQQHFRAEEIKVDPGTGGGNVSSLAPTAATNGPPGTKPGDKNPWRSVFDPGYNPNMYRVGSQYYDTVTDRHAEPSVWEYIVKAEQLNRGSFQEIDRRGKGYLDKEDLSAAFDGRYGDTRQLFDQADENKDGRIDEEEFRKMVASRNQVDDLTSQGGVAWTE